MRAAIPFQLPQESGLSELAGAQAFAANVVVDPKGAIRRRPGLVAPTGLFSDTVDEDGLSALHVTSYDKIFAIGATPLSKRVFRVNESLFEITGDPSVAKIAGTGRPVIAETEAMLVIASGVAPRKLLFSDESLSLLGGSPPNCTHIIANNSRLLANDVSSKGLIYYSGQALGSSIDGHETWSGLTTGFFSHEARPDPLLALHENTNEVFGFGSTSLQVWAPDDVFAYAPAATREYGNVAPYGVLKREQSFAWIDHQRRIVLSDGRSAEVISPPIQQSLDDMSTISDAWAFWFHEGVVDCLVWVFPTERRTFCYYIGRGWSEWLGWSGANWGPMNLGCFAARPYLGQRLAGTLDGKIARLTMSAQTDLGEPIVASIRTGFQNRDTDSYKACSAVYVALRRGTTDGTGLPIAWLSWRDAEDADWTRVPVDLGSYSDREPVVRLPGFGFYRRRQWRFEMSEPDLELVSVEEEFTINEV